ncbi:MAG: threonine-phosphate decarboxylase CobD [Xanthobacteraceae bacterium]
MVALVGESEPLVHGGDLAAARRLFPGAAEPFIDLSTGINPNPYPLPRLGAAAFAHLPSSADTASLAEAAARAYGAPSAAHVVPAPGTQILLPLVAGLVRAGRAAILAPTYGEFARAAALAGHDVAEVADFARLREAQLVFVCNPNNPDGRLFAKNDLIVLANDLRARGGLLAVDEAFMDVAPPSISLAAEVGLGNIVVLRSFGKFFGVAGLRLGFAVAAPPLAARIAALLGPWAVSGPALAVGSQALADTPWIEQTKTRLAAAAQRLDALLTSVGLDIIGGTSLFRLVRTPAADELFCHLGRAGILVRAFAGHPHWLRFGLPPDEAAGRRLHDAMAAFRGDRAPCTSPS